MKFLLFADLHQFNTVDVEKIQEDFDVIVFLGDINAVAIRYILNTFPSKPAYAVLGNHDDESVFTSVNNLLKIEREVLGISFAYPLEDLNLKRTVLDGISFVGLQGSVKYKERCIGYTQEEASLLNIPAANILFSHETGYHFVPYKEYSASHEGFRSVSDYIKEKSPKYHIFGHHHKDMQFQKGETTCFCVYGCSIFDCDNGIMKKLF